MTAGKAIALVSALGVGWYFFTQSNRTAPVYPLGSIPPPQVGGGGMTSAPSPLRQIQNSVSVYGVNVGAVAGAIGDQAGKAPTAVKVLLPVVGLWGITQGFINNPSKEAGSVVGGVKTVASTITHGVSSVASTLTGWL